jgi:hypothetical protein
MYVDQLQMQHKVVVEPVLYLYVNEGRVNASSESLVHHSKHQYSIYQRNCRLTNFVMIAAVIWYCAHALTTVGFSANGHGVPC